MRLDKQYLTHGDVQGVGDKTPQNEIPLTTQ